MSTKHFGPNFIRDQCVGVRLSCAARIEFWPVSLSTVLGSPSYADVQVDFCLPTDFRQPSVAGKPLLQRRFFQNFHGIVFRILSLGENRVLDTNAARFSRPSQRYRKGELNAVMRIAKEPTRKEKTPRQREQNEFYT